MDTAWKEQSMAGEASPPGTGGEPAAAPEETGQDTGEGMRPAQSAVVPEGTGQEQGKGMRPFPSAVAGQGEGKPSWEEILRDPDYRSSYDAAVQSIVQRRLRGRQDAEEKLRRLEPVLEALEERFRGADAEAMAAGLREQARDREAREELRRHLQSMQEQAQRLRESVPDFDLAGALDDPAFLRLTAPHSGVRVEDAYYALHRDEIGRAAARRSLEALSRSIMSQAARPRELRAPGAGARFATDPKSMSRQEREALKKRILEAKAQGKRLTVGD